MQNRFVCRLVASLLAGVQLPVQVVAVDEDMVFRSTKRRSLNVAGVRMCIPVSLIPGKFDFGLNACSASGSMPKAIAQPDYYFNSIAEDA